MILIYNNLGKILSSVDSNDSEFLETVIDNALNIGNNVIKSDEEIDINQYYVEGDNFYVEGHLIKIPEKPNSYSKFKYENKSWEIDENLLIILIGNQRLEKLTQSDWTDTVTAQTRLTNWQEWQDYRQALRDITKQAGYPLDVIWPEQPK